MSRHRSAPARRRGQPEGVSDEQLAAEWMRQVLRGPGPACTASEQGEQGVLAKFDAAATVIRTLERGTAAGTGGRAGPARPS